ncbi:DUF11 domain-containing protein [Erythrobacteraceae bacterium CFH 75059]|uniref:DUF11 domain-containing protein n=1 Tax=Qipengyuania thermophila TaxID=2509361 RepID=UPI00102197A3|nr:DUF11 domain-containing protein [Qipengyuania thermophila]TCD06588.1 DUF11 domain-containing protein [Erythrobacteraceae bacterium CFH 75059]
MRRTSTWLAAVSGLALVSTPIAAQSAPVGTASGTDITNTVQVNYTVGGVAQNQITATDTFKVDRRINVTVATLDTAAVTVSPGQTNAVTTFTVTNNSNATLDFLLAATNQASGAATFGGNDNFNVTNIRIFRETGTTAGFDASDQLVTSLSNLASGDAATVYVVSDMIITPGSPPVLPANGDIATVILSATAASGGTAITQTPSTTPNGRTTVETIFADLAGVATGDTARDGRHSARSDYRVSGAALTVTKVSRVIDDYLGSSSPRSVPGALVEYCIVVTNASGAAAANALALTDVVPAAMTYEPGTVYLNGAFTAPDTCAATGGTAGSDSANYNAGTRTVSHTFSSIGAGETRTLRFRAKIN